MINKIDIFGLRNGSTKKVATIPCDNSFHNTSMMAKDELSVSVVTDKPLNLVVGDYITIGDTSYRMNRDAEFTQKSEVQHEYSIIFEHPIYTLLDKVLCNRITGSTKVVLTGKLRDFLELLMWNVNRSEDNPLGVDTGWKIGLCPDTEYRNIILDGISCRASLDEFRKAFDLEYYVTNKTINFVSHIEKETGLTFIQGRGGGLYSLEQKNVDSGDVVTRLFPKGGTENVIPGEGDEDGRLILPEKYIEDFSETTKVVERVIHFDNIHPTFQGVVGPLSGEHNKSFVCSEIDFDIKEFAVGTDARVNFLTGDLMGKAFEFDWDNDNKKITLLSQVDELAFVDKETGAKPNIPNSNKYLRGGELFTLTGLRMSGTYKENAISALREKGREWLKYHCRKRVKYNLDVDYRMLRGKRTLSVGDLVTIKDKNRGINALIRIVSVERNLRTGKLSCVVSNYLDEKWEKRIEGQIASVQTAISGGGYSSGNVDIIEKNDAREFTDSRILSSLRTIKEIIERSLSRQGDDTAEGLITFLKGLKSLAPITIGDFTTGMIGGSGGSIGIDSAGKSVAELDKAVFREGVIVPKITFNCIDVISGDKANTFAFGTIKEVDMANRIVILDLLDDQAGTSKSGDICRGVFHRLEGGNPVSDSYDLNGFLNYAGYATSYFTPTEILRNEPGAMSFRYTLQPGTHVHPCAGMTFYAYGSFTDASRRSMTYENRYYTRRLKDVDTWVIDPTKNISMQDGLLEGLTIGGMQMHGVGTFMENAYMTGVNIHFTPSQIETLQGQSAYSVSLSSYERVVKMDGSDNLTTLYEELNVISGEGNVVSGDENVVTSVYNLSTRIQAFKGDKELLYSDSVQEDGYIVILSPKGCKASVSAGVLTITEITGYEECYVDLKINCEGNAVFDKRFSVVIVRNGGHGENAVIYSLQPSVGIIKRDGSGNSDVSHISCRVLKTDGGYTHVSDLPFGYSVEYRIDEGNWKWYKLGTPIATEGIAGKIEFSLLHQEQFYTRIDYKQIYVVTDGQDGEEGKPGAPGAPGTPGTDGKDGKDGKDGRYTELRYMYSFGRPLAPSGTSPAGWSLSPDLPELTYTHTGDFILSDGAYTSPSPAANSATYRHRVRFDTPRPDCVVHMLVSVSSEPNYDWGIVCPVDVEYRTGGPVYWKRSGVVSETLVFIVPSAGSHFIDIVYKKGPFGKQNDDRMEYRIVQPRTCWLSTAVISPSGSPAPVWSAPVEFPTDTPAEERIYLLGKSHIIADFPYSDPYRDEYIGEAPAYDTSKPYVRGNVVRHGGAHKICLAGCTGISPDDPDKWEDVGWWTDNPSGAGESFPYEYSCSRKFASGKWGAYGNMSLFSHFAKDGSDGEAPVVTRLVPSVSQIGRTLTGSYEPESFAVWHKDTGGFPVKAYMAVWGSNDGSYWARVGSVENVSVKTVDVSRYPYKYFTIRTYTAPSVSFGSDYLLSASVTVLSDGEKGADGDTGAMPVYCGFFEQGTEYRYTDTARDIVNYRIDGEVFTFQVRTRGSVVTTPPSSSVGDDNWEPASRFKFVAMDTALIDGADIAGFLYKDGMMKSRKGLLRGQELNVSDVSPEDMYMFKPYLQFDGNKGLVNAVANVNTHFQVLDAGTDLKKNLSWMVLDAAGYNRISNLGESVGIPLYMHELGSPVFIGNMYNYSLSIFLTIQLPKSGDVFSTYPERAKITIAAGKMFRGVVIPNGDTYRRGGLNTKEEDGSSVHYPFGLSIYPLSELKYLGMTKTQYEEDLGHYEVVH